MNDLELKRLEKEILSALSNSDGKIHIDLLDKITGVFDTEIRKDQFKQANENLIIKHKKDVEINQLELETLKGIFLTEQTILQELEDGTIDADDATIEGLELIYGIE